MEVDVSPLKAPDVAPPSPPAIVISEETLASNVEAQAADPPPPPAPSPRAVSSLGKNDLQALINARMKNSMSNRKTFDPQTTSSTGPPGAVMTAFGMVAPPSPPRSPKVDRFNTKYLSPGGQTINFTTRAVNTPPTPKFTGGKKAAAAVSDVKWDAYTGAPGSPRHALHILPP